MSNEVEQWPESIERWSETEDLCQFLNCFRDWHDDFVKVPPLWNAVPIIDQYKFFMFEMKAAPYILGFSKEGR